VTGSTSAEPGPMASADTLPDASTLPDSPASSKTQTPADDTQAAPSALEMFIELYDEEYHQVVRHLVRLGADLQSAEDAAQEAFSYAWARYLRLGTWVEEIDDPRGWLRTVAHNNYRRPPGRPRKQPPPVLMADPYAPAGTGGSPELSLETLTVLDELKKLSPELQKVMGYHLDGFSAPEIAALLDVTPQKARDLLKKARKILAKKLGTARNEERRVQ